MAKTAKSKRVDELLVGYVFPYDKDKNPYDYMDPPAGQLRTGGERSGSMLHDLTKGLSGVIIPPLMTWKEGDWWNEDLHGKEIPMQQWPNERDMYDTFVVTGEGTPGSWKFRMYVLPQEVSRHDLEDNNLPKHPGMWPKKLRDQLGKSHASSYTGGWSSTSTTSKSSLPYGVMIRCVQCGHWFEQDDIAGHMHCCPTVQGMSDWAIKCECCSSVDDTVTVKQGFPRDPILPKEVKDGEGNGSTERASAAADDTKGSSVASG